jgi:hypothetical protein
MMRSADRTRAGLFAAFAGLGVTASFFPAILPTAERVVGEDVSAAVPALFGGVLIGVLAVGTMLRIRPLRHVLALGGILQTVAIVLGALATDQMVFIAAAAAAGLGFGIIEAAGSITAKQVSSGSATGLLSALTGTVAVTAALTPILVAFGSATPVALSALGIVPLAALLLLRSSPEGVAPTTSWSQYGRAGTLPLLMFALALPLYVGVETVLSGWSAVIPERALELDAATAALGTSAFWVLMAVGRFASAALRRHGIPAIVILLCASGSAGLLLGSAGALMHPYPMWALIALGGAVIALAPSYGLILGLALDRVDDVHASAITGLLVACGAVGGTIIPTVILLIGSTPTSGVTFAASAVLCLVVPALAAIGLRRMALTPRSGQGHLGAGDS